MSLETELVFLVYEVVHFSKGKKNEATKKQPIKHAV